MFFDDFRLNDTVEIPPVVIEKEEMMSFARKYDPFPLHTDEEYAKTTHFGQVIAPGVMSFMCVWASYLKVAKIDKELLAGKTTKIEWYKPVFAGDVLSGKAVVTSLQKRNPRNGTVEVTIYVYNQHGELVITDITEAIVKCRET